MTHNASGEFNKERKMTVAGCVVMAQGMAVETHSITKLLGIGLITFGIFIGYYIRSLYELED